ncbi:MAG: asparaginase [Legionella sp.]|uniref:asparaginase n=1 Tax=Legionella sp. TaxID=459 RepID=UPI00284B8B1C|nr:asparaginase [Legionella sp.]
MNNAQKVIGIIELGGTISCISEDSTSEFYKGPSTSVSSFIQEFKLEPHVKIIIEQFAQRISHEMTIEGLLGLAQRIQSLLDSSDFDGVIITTGTNALEDIAYFIGLAVKSIKPIIFTGAHYPQNSLAFDGKRNLYNAINIASSDNAMKLGVLVTFNDHVITARDAVKNTPGLNSNFALEGIGVVGHVIGGKFILKSTPMYKHTYQSEFSILGLNNLPKVSIIYAHLGMDDSLIKASITSGVSGIVSAGFGKGYQPTHISQALAKAAQLNIPIVRCSRFGFSYTSIDQAYDEKYGFIVAKGLSPHKSSLLLSLALNKTSEISRLQQIFEEY